MSAGTERQANQSTRDEEVDEQERLAGELAVIEAENERLRTEYARLQQTQYRQTAIALGVTGLIAAVGAVLFPTARTVLFALAGTGLFLAILTYFLAPEQFLPATVGRDIYGTLAANERAVVDELGLCETRIYFPLDSQQQVRLYVPQSSSAPLPDETALADTFVVTPACRGLSLQPTGNALFEQFERALTDELASEPAPLAAQLRDALVEQFELVESAEQSVPADVTREQGELTVGGLTSVYGAVEQFDHPVVSFLGVGLARGLQQPVEVAVEPDGNDRVDFVVTCRWPHDPSE